MLDNCNNTYIRHVKSIATELFQLLNTLNTSFMNEIFNVKDTPYFSKIQI